MGGQGSEGPRVEASSIEGPSMEARGSVGSSAEVQSGVESNRNMWGGQGLSAETLGSVVHGGWREQEEGQVLRAGSRGSMWQVGAV